MKEYAYSEARQRLTEVLDVPAVELGLDRAEILSLVREGRRPA